MKNWGADEDEFLINNYPTHGKMYCAKILNRSESSIRSRTSILQLKLATNSSFFHEFQGKARIAKIGKKRPNHSRRMKELAAEGRFPVLTHKRSAEEKEIYSKRLKLTIKTKGHPKGMLNKTHTDAVKTLCSINSKKMWANPNSKVNSKEHRQFLSDKFSKFVQSRPNHNAYSRCKSGTYNINDKDMFFRSAWEANYALYLDWLISQKQIKEWFYEKDTFWFETIKRGIRSYKPDFKIINFDDTFEYHEVKGWMDPKSITKLKRMKKYYPHIKLLIVDATYYKDLKNKVGQFLHFF